MLNIRDNFNVKPSKLKKALDADVAVLFKGLFFALEQNPIDKNQQALLDEVKIFADSLKNTILDKGESTNESTSDGQAKLFLSKLIKKESDSEQSKPLPQKGWKKSDQNLSKKPDKPENQQIDISESENLSSPNENGKIKVSQTKIRVQAGRINPVYNNGLKEKIDPIDDAQEQDHPTSIVKLKNMVVEKVQILEILQRQAVQNKFSPKDSEIESESIAQPKNIGIIAGKKNSEPKGKILFEKQLSKKGLKLTKTQEASVEKLLDETKAKKLNRIVEIKRPPQKAAIKLDEIFPGQLNQKRDKGPMNHPLNKAAENDSKAFNNQSMETKKEVIPIKPTVKFDQKIDDALNKGYMGLEPDKDTRLVKDPPQNRQPWKIQNQNTQISNTQNQNLEGQTAASTREDPGNGIPEELQTAVQWMAQEEVENKLVELLSRQAKLRGVDLS